MKIKTKTIIDFSFGNITPEPLNWLKKRYKVHHITRHNLYKHFKKKKAMEQRCFCFSLYQSHNNDLQNKA